MVILMEYKNVLTIVLVMVAAILAYNILFNQGSTQDLNFLKNQKADTAAFLKNLEDAEKIYIVQDLRGANESVRKNIQQCGVDFAGSTGLVGKKMVTFAFEGNECISFDSKMTVDACIKEITTSTASTLFYIRKGMNSTTSSTAYPSVLLIDMGNEYQLRSCNVNPLTKTETAPKTDTINISEKLNQLFNISENESNATINITEEN